MTSNRPAHHGTSTRFSPAVVAPTFNNAKTLLDVLQRVERIGLPIFVVNDGSTDETPEHLSTWTLQGRTVPVTVLTHTRNQGKAAAMRSGFAAARAAGHTHAATIDTDGQLDPDDIPALVAAAREEPRAIVLGTRRRDIKGCPKINRLGWWLAALGIFLETGCRVLDSQCGLRVYPLGVLEFIRCRSRRYGFESEVITRANWAGCPLVQIPVTCHYFSPSQRVSHFKPLRDGVQSYLMHFALTLRRIAPWPSARFPFPASSKRTSSSMAIGTCSESRSPVAGEKWDWIKPLAVWRRLRDDRFEQSLIATALGIGAFISNIPMGGWQTVLAAYVAWRTHVHIVPVVAASFLCFTAVGPALNKLAIGIGYVLLHFSLPEIETLAPESLNHLQRLSRVPVSWPTGALILGFFCTWIVILAFERLFRLIPVRRNLCEP